MRFEVLNYFLGQTENIEPLKTIPKTVRDITLGDALTVQRQGEGVHD
jgi:hypothetical protein